MEHQGDAYTEIYVSTVFAKERYPCQRLVQDWNTPQARLKVFLEAVAVF